jgi:O-antigen/teichoic acid export membrane protein
MATLDRPAAASAPAGVSVMRGAMALVTTQPLTWAASLLTAIFVPRFLGDQGLGQYVVVVTIANLAGLVAALGVPTYLRRHVATQPTRAAIDGSAALVLLVGLAILIAAALAVAMPLLGFPIGEEYVLSLALAGMVVATAQTVVLSILIGQERHGRYAWFNAALVVASTAVGMGILFAGGDVRAYLTAGVATSAVITALGWYASGLRLHRPAWDPQLWRQLARNGLPFLGWNLALQIYGEIDKILLAVLSTEAVVGWYAAAYRIISIPVFIPTAITGPLLPVLSRYVEDRALFQHTLWQSVRAVLILTVPVCALVIALAPAVPELLQWPSTFHNSVPLLVILALHLPIVAVDMVLATALFALKREREWLCVGVAAAIFNPTVNLLLIPYFERTLHNGAIGAAIATVVTELMMLGGALILMPRGLVDRSLANLSGRIVTAGVCATLVAAELRTISLPLAVTVGSIVFVVAAAALGALRSTDLWKIRQVMLQSWARRPVGSPAGSTQTQPGPYAQGADHKPY